jgi:hypothetical protein
MLDSFIDWLEDFWPMLIAVTLTVLLLVAAVYLAIQDSRRWAHYSVEHHCVAKGVKKGQVVTSVGPSMGGDGGVAITTGVTPDQTVYVCDGGEIVIR